MNLLTNIPLKTTTPLLNPLKRDLVSPDLKEIEYDGACVNAIKAMLDLLLARVENVRTKLIRFSE